MSTIISNSTIFGTKQRNIIRTRKFSGFGKVQKGRLHTLNGKVNKISPEKRLIVKEKIIKSDSSSCDSISNTGE